MLSTDLTPGLLTGPVVNIHIVTRNALPPSASTNSTSGIISHRSTAIIPLPLLPPSSPSPFAFAGALLPNDLAEIDQIAHCHLGALSPLIRVEEFLLIVNVALLLEHLLDAAELDGVAAQHELKVRQLQFRAPTVTGRAHGVVARLDDEVREDLVEHPYGFREGLVEWFCVAGIVGGGGGVGACGRAATVFVEVLL